MDCHQVQSQRRENITFTRTNEYGSFMLHASFFVAIRLVLQTLVVNFLKLGHKIFSKYAQMVGGLMSVAEGIHNAVTLLLPDSWYSLPEL